MLQGGRLGRNQPTAETLGAADILIMSFSHRLRQLAQPIWDAQLSHPFVVALGNGTLPERKFRYYILQDARFLGDLARVFSAAALRAPDSNSALRLTKLAEETIVVERSLHEGYGAKWKMSAKQMTSVPMAPTTYAYTRHMLAVAHSGSAAEITVVALPCAWIYCVVGRHLLRNGPPPKRHPYRDWLMLYASPEFADVQRWMRKKVDEWAKLAGEAEKRRMEESFVISSRYEWMFWEMAWTEEKWPV
jgi:thiaminase/transcriptional activator TenA